MRYATIHHCDVGMNSGPDAMVQKFDDKEQAERHHAKLAKRREVAAVFFYEIEDEPMEFWRLTNFTFCRA